MKKIILSVLCFAIYSSITGIGSLSAFPSENWDSSLTIARPVFKNLEMNKKLSEYQKLVQQYSEALKNEDQQMIKSYKEQISLWSKETIDLVVTLNGAEQSQLSEYVRSLNEQFISLEKTEEEHNH